MFLDADVSVVNTKRRIEEYIDERHDLIMYNRFANWEIAMGSYLAKNTPWTRNFLLKFAEYETKLPASYHGTDNGAIHAFVLKELLPETLPIAKPCFQIWNKSTGMDDLFMYEACIRHVMGARNSVDRFRIVPKGRGWVRDVWLTKSRWSEERDFMLHGFKTSDRRTRTGFDLLDSIREYRSSIYIWYSFLEEDLQPETAPGIMILL